MSRTAIITCDRCQTPLVNDEQRQKYASIVVYVGSVVTAHVGERQNDEKVMEHHWCLRHLTDDTAPVTDLLKAVGVSNIISFHISIMNPAEEIPL